MTNTQTPSDWDRYWALADARAAARPARPTARPTARPAARPTRGARIFRALTGMSL